MPVIYILNKQNSLLKEPYLSFDKKYKMIFEQLHGSAIELPIGIGKPGQFSNGFYNCDYAYQRNMMMKFNFVKVNPEQVEISIYMDAIVAGRENVQQVCHSMINQFIAVFSLDD